MDWIMGKVVIVFMCAIGLLICSIPLVIYCNSQQEKRCKEQYNQSVQQGKNLLDYECYKRIQPKDSTFVPIIIPIK